MKVLVVAQSDLVRKYIESVFVSDKNQVVSVSEGKDARAAVDIHRPDVAICDMQSGSMGGIAVFMELRLEFSADRLPYVPVVLLLDRQPDDHLAKRFDIDAFLVKPLDAISLKKTVDQLVLASIDKL